LTVVKSVSILCAGVVAALLLFCGSCRRSGDRVSGGDVSVKTRLKPAFFSLKKFFVGEAARLRRDRYRLSKTVLYERATEKHVVGVGSWEKELGIFADADINKSAWIDKYRTTSTARQITYAAVDSSLKVKSITISRDVKNAASADGSVHEIMINLSTSNFLYNMSEQLSYFPDSGYSIQRMQNIKVLGRKTYDIQAAFLK